MKKLHDSSLKDLEGKLQKLEADVAVSQELQEDATEIEFKPTIDNSRILWTYIC